MFLIERRKSMHYLSWCTGCGFRQQIDTQRYHIKVTDLGHLFIQALRITWDLRMLHDDPKNIRYSLEWDCLSNIVTLNLLLERCNSNEVKDLSKNLLLIASTFKILTPCTPRRYPSKHSMIEKLLRHHLSNPQQTASGCRLPWQKLTTMVSRVITKPMKIKLSSVVRARPQMCAYLMSRGCWGDRKTRLRNILRLWSGLPSILILRMRVSRNSLTSHALSSTGELRTLGYAFGYLLLKREPTIKAVSLGNKAGSPAWIPMIVLQYSSTPLRPGVRHWTPRRQWLV